MKKTKKLFSEMTTQEKNKHIIKRIVIGVIFMFGFAYMLVPLYTLVCKHAGLNGRSANIIARIDPGMKPDLSRTIQVEFTTTIHGNMNFEFRPLLHHIDVHPGQPTLVYFFAHNKTGHGITVQAIPSITPDYSAKYFKKTQCFCFTQQYFFNNEKADMPVYFFIEPEISKDTKAMTLSYTLFDATQHLKNQKHYVKGRIELNT